MQGQGWCNNTNNQTYLNLYFVIEAGINWYIQIMGQVSLNNGYIREYFFLFKECLFVKFFYFIVSLSWKEVD